MNSTFRRLLRNMKEREKGFSVLAIRERGEFYPETSCQANRNKEGAALGSSSS